MLYGTFGQGTPLRNHYVEIDSGDYDEATAIMKRMFGTSWAFIYTEDKFRGQLERYSLQCLCRIGLDGRGYWTAFADNDGQDS